MNHLYQMRNESYLFSVSTNNSFRSHLHKQIEMVHVLSGEIQVTIGDETKLLKKDDIAIAFPNTIHRYQTFTESQMQLFIFDAAFVSDFSNEFFNLKLQNPFIEGPEVPPSVLRCFELLLGVDKQVDSRIVKGHLLAILGSLFQTLPFVRHTHPNDVNLSQQLLLYIDANYTKDITLASISHQFGVSKFYVSHIFSEKLGITFTAYLNSLRIQRAKHLLLTTNDSITDIAYHSGFNSLRTFFRAFQKECNLTPKEYRKV